jgi:hypothetical protein
VLRVQEEERHGHSILSEGAGVGEDQDPWMLYLYAMKSAATKEKYLMRLHRCFVKSAIEESNEGKNVRNLWYAFVPKRLITYFYPLLL